MYEPDPFAARRQVEARQAKAAEKRSQSADDSNKRHDNSPLTSEFSQEPEVRMANSLRELTEEAIKKVNIYHPLWAKFLVMLSTRNSLCTRQRFHLISALKKRIIASLSWSAWDLHQARVKMLQISCLQILCSLVPFFVRFRLWKPALNI